MKAKSGLRCRALAALPYLRSTGSKSVPKSVPNRQFQP